MTRGERMIAFIEAFCHVPDGVLVGRLMVLERFQKDFILDVYDNTKITRMGILSIGRKNGKTGLIAAILLGHIAGPEAKLNSQIVSGALSREQAALVFDLACKIIKLSPELSSLTSITPSGKKIVGLALNVEFQALASDGRTKHGLSPILAILDETGQVRGSKNDFIDAITTAQGAHENPLLLVISTQAPNDADLLSIWIDDAQKSADPHIVCHVHTAPKGCDVLDEKGWKAANPAIGIFRSEKDVREMAEKAKRMPSFTPTFRNLVLNQRVEMNSPFISRDLWLSNDYPVSEDAFLYGDVYAGLDLSSRLDLTALAVCALYKSIWHVKMYFWTPDEGLNDRTEKDRTPYDEWVSAGYISATVGASIDYEVVAADIADILQPYNVISVAYDRWRIDLMKKEFEKLGVAIPLKEFGQGFRDMAPAIDSLEEIIFNKRLAHGNNPVLTACMSNTRIEKDAAGNRKLNKAKSTGRIDGAVALTMALGVQCETSNDETARLNDFFGV